ncbi:biopolymer transport protein TolR [Pseudomonas duriflava]|uniref:Tol-Pal system protein TolR n=1 Tax=Pseudomonas duriflava TaxID=459528 RepID=A0A562Q754_9PSED|nr:protein TolR [Pseudomonas duriflava]TWI52538.1 biopolymer transport protein TolR [Pseudomonas duriflava]
MLLTRTRKHKPKSEMNVVPYIDVMLVLLVIFMVTAPMIQQGVKVNLPKVASEALPTLHDQQVLTLTVTADGHYHWNLGPAVEVNGRTDEAASLDEMTAKVSQIMRVRSDTQVLIRADSAVDYHAVVSAMAALQKGGVPNVGLITEAPQS